MSKIDSIGTYVGEIVESGLGTTKNGFPQWVARLKATKKFVDSPEDLAHFSLTEPGYVDWSGFDEEIVAFMVLFKDKDEFSKDTALLNYEQLQLATGWDGSEFDTLANGSLLKKSILFRVGENTYEGKTSLRVDWIDNESASPERQLKTLDMAEVKNLAAKLKINKVVKPAAPAKPGAKPAATKPAPAPAGNRPRPPPCVLSGPAPSARPLHRRRVLLVRVLRRRRHALLARRPRRRRRRRRSPPSSRPRRPRPPACPPRPRRAMRGTTSSPTRAATVTT
jgi:hypothetical protein